MNGQWWPITLSLLNQQLRSPRVSEEVELGTGSGLLSIHRCTYIAGHIQRPAHHADGVDSSKRLWVLLVC